MERFGKNEYPSGLFCAGYSSHDRWFDVEGDLDDFIFYPDNSNEDEYEQFEEFFPYHSRK